MNWRQAAAHSVCNLVIVLIVSFVIAAFVLSYLFVAPGPLRYQYSLQPQGLIRVDRLTSKVAHYNGGEFDSVDGFTDQIVVYSKP